VIRHIKVLKFGGTSVADAEAFARAARIVYANFDAPLVVVVSAMSGVTDALLRSVNIRASNGFLDEQFERHLKAAEPLGAEGVAKCHALIESSRREIVALLDSGVAGLQTQDAIAAYGEMLCAKLFTLILEHHGVPASYVDARRCILTDDEHGSANPVIFGVVLRSRAELNPLLKTHRVPVLGGFVGATAAGITTTLGRGSSDYSATLIGAALQASEIQIWTDVNGVQTADPDLVTETRTVPVISYEEAAQLAVLGARVMHPRMMEPVIGGQIPIRIRNSSFPEQSGTLICTSSGPPEGVVKAIAHRVNRDHAIVGCVGDGLSNGNRGAANVRRVLREIDPAVTWRSTAASNLVAVVAPDRVSELVKRVHELLLSVRRVCD
jgi:aspartate kinase